MSTDICIKLFTRRRIKRDRWSSFSTSLKFYQTILQSTPQKRIHVRHREVIINRWANIYSQRNTGRPAENCDQLAWILSNSQRRSQYWLKQSRKYSTTCIVALLHNSLCCCFTFLHFITMWWHEINLLRCSFSSKVLVQSFKKPQTKRKSLQCYRAFRGSCMEDKMFISRNYWSKWPTEFDWSSPRSGRTLSVDQPFFSVLISVNPSHQGITGDPDSQQPTGSQIIRICMEIYCEIDKTVKTHINSHLCVCTVYLIKSCVCVVFLLFVTI